MPARIQQLVAGILFVALTIVIIAVIGQPNHIKTHSDLTKWNSDHMNKQKTFYKSVKAMCSFSCSQSSEASINMGVWFLETGKCQCFYADEDFKDVRKVAPQNLETQAISLRL